MIILCVMGSIVISGLPLDLASALGKPAVHGLPIFTGLSLTLVVGLIVISRRFQDKCFGETKNSTLVKKIVQVLNLVIRLPYSTYVSLVVFSALFQATHILASFIIAKALNISVPLILFFPIMPIVYILTLLPVSLGGLGVREGILVYLLGNVGVSPSDAVALSLLIYFNRVIIGAVGGITHMFWESRSFLNSFRALKLFSGGLKF